MPSSWSTYPLEFKGGLISNLTQLQHGINMPGSATYLENFEVAKTGGYKKINGYSTYDDTALTGIGNVLAVAITDTLSHVYAARVEATDTNTVYYKSTGYDASTKTYSGWTSLGSVTKSTNPIDHVNVTFVGTETTVFVDGSNYPHYTTGTSITAMTSANSSDLSGANIVTTYKNHVFFAVGKLLVHSAPFSLTDYSAANGGAVYTFDSEITGLINFRDQLFIFTKKNIRVLSGSTIANFTINPVAEDIGCIDFRTVKEVGGDVMFLSLGGLRLLSATDRLNDFGINLPTDSVYKQINELINSSNDYTSVTIPSKAQYRLFAANSSVNRESAKGISGTKLVAQGGEGFQWSTLRGILVLCADHKAYGDEELVVFGNSDGYVYKMDDGITFGSSRDSVTGNLTGGTTVMSVFQTPYIPITDPSVRKTFYRVTFYLDIQGEFSADAQLMIDYGAGIEAGVVQPEPFTITNAGSVPGVYGDYNYAYGSANFGSVIDYTYDNHLRGSGKVFALRLEDVSTSAPYTIDSAVIEFKENDRN